MFTCVCLVLRHTQKGLAQRQTKIYADEEKTELFICKLSQLEIVIV